MNLLDLCDVPPVDPGTHGPTGDPLPPIAPSRHLHARHASYTGAKAAIKTWGIKVSAYLQVLKNSGGMTDQDAAVQLHCGLSSINSIRNSLGDRIEPCGFDSQEFDGGRITRRTIWRVRQTKELR